MDDQEIRDHHAPHARIILQAAEIERLQAENVALRAKARAQDEEDNKYLYTIRLAHYWLGQGYPKQALDALRNALYAAGEKPEKEAYKYYDGPHLFEDSNDESGVDEEFMDHLERGEHLTDDFLKHAARESYSQVSPTTLAEWQSLADAAANEFRETLGHLLSWSGVNV